MTDRYNDPWYLELGKRLCGARRAHGWSLTEAAGKADGLTSTAIGSWERGDRHPKAKIVAQLAALYKIPLTDLLPDESKDPMTAEDWMSRIEHDTAKLRALLITPPLLIAPLPVRTPGATYIPQQARPTVRMPLDPR